MNRNLLLLVIIGILLCSTSNLCAEDTKSLKNPFIPYDALILLYGGKTFEDARLGKYFQGQTTGYISLAFETAYIENGQEKHMVIAHITPEPVDEYFCHACYKLIGGAVFSKTGNVWRIESENKIIGWAGSMICEEKIDLVQVGPHRYGTMLSVEDDFQGYETKLVHLIIPYNGVLS
jgi:hypothetical protein